MILIIFFISCFCFMLFQLLEFIQNYDYIVNFNNKYSKYEFTSSPSVYYTDLSVFDPNDYNDDKWKCVETNIGWFAISNKNITYNPDKIDNVKLEEMCKFENKLECYRHIFEENELNVNSLEFFCNNSKSLNLPFCNI